MIDRRSLLVGVAAAVAGTGAAGRAAAIDAATAAGQAAYDISVLESQGNTDAIYDRMHPDAQVIVDRATVDHWYRASFLPNGPGPITVTGVRMVAWAWPVTGRVYPQTAEVSFYQPFATGGVDEIVRMVQGYDGEWHWFFGRSVEFVRNQMEAATGHPFAFGPLPVRTGMTPNHLFGEGIAALASIDPACVTAASLTRAAPSAVLSFPRREDGGLDWYDPVGDFMTAVGIQVGEIAQGDSVPAAMDRAINDPGNYQVGPMTDITIELLPDTPWLVTYGEVAADAVGPYCEIIFGRWDGPFLATIWAPRPEAITPLLVALAAAHPGCGG